MFAGHEAGYFATWFKYSAAVAIIIIWRHGLAFSLHRTPIVLTNYTNWHCSIILAIVDADRWLITPRMHM